MSSIEKTSNLEVSRYKTWYINLDSDNEDDHEAIQPVLFPDATNMVRTVDVRVETVEETRETVGVVNIIVAQIDGSNSFKHRLVEHIPCPLIS